MKTLTLMMTALAGLAGLAGGGLPMKEWKNELRSRNGRRPRAEIQARQRRWIARRHQDGVWRYDGRVTEGGGR